MHLKKIILLGISFLSAIFTHAMQDLERLALIEQSHIQYFTGLSIDIIKKIEYPAHARDRMQPINKYTIAKGIIYAAQGYHGLKHFISRNIPQSVVETTLANPTKVVPGRDDKLIYQRDGIHVVFSPTECKVISAYRKNIVGIYPRYQAALEELEKKSLENFPTGNKDFRPSHYQQTQKVAQQVLKKHGLDIVDKQHERKQKRQALQQECRKLSKSAYY